MPSMYRVVPERGGSESFANPGEARFRDKKDSGLADMQSMDLFPCVASPEASSTSTRLPERRHSRAAPASRTTHRNHTWSDTECGRQPSERENLRHQSYSAKRPRISDRPSPITRC